MLRAAIALMLLAGGAVAAPAAAPTVPAPPRATPAAPKPAAPKPAPAAPAPAAPAPATPAAPKPAPAAPAAPAPAAPAAPAPAAPKPAPAPAPPAAPAPAAPAPAPAPADADPDPIVEDDPDPASDPAPQPSAATFGVTPPPPAMVRETSRLLEDARKAREAAAAGRCGVAIKLSPKVRKRDPDFYAQVFARDPLIVACLDPNVPPPVPMPSAAAPVRFVLRERRADPPASATRIVGEILFGLVVGSSGALVGALLGNAVCLGGDEDTGESCDASLIGGAYAGAVATIPFGVRAVGKYGDQTGSLGMTYLGSLLGGLGGLLMLANGRDDITTLGLIFAPPIGATIGFNMTRRYRARRVMVTGALLQWHDGAGVSLGVPIPVRTRAEERTVTSLPLLGGTF